MNNYRIKWNKDAKIHTKALLDAVRSMFAWGIQPPSRNFWPSSMTLYQEPEEEKELVLDKTPNPDFDSFTEKE